MLRLAEEPSPGPGAYGAPAPPTARLFEKRRAATAAPPSSWALSSTARLPLNEQAARRGSDPGQYEPRRQTVAGEAAASPSLLSSRGRRGWGTAREAEGPLGAAPDSHRTPGPGFYSPEVVVAAAAPPPSGVPFATGAERPCLARKPRPRSVPPRLGYGLSPMPWAVGRGEAPPPGSGLAEPRESPPFRSRQPRLPPPRSATPPLVGPGGYTPEASLKSETHGGYTFRKTGQEVHSW